MVAGEEKREEKTHRHRENSLVFRFMKTLNLLDQCSTLRAQLMLMGFSGGSDGKESVCNVRYPGLIPGLERSPGEEKGYPQYGHLENSMDRGTWQAPRGLKESDTTERLHCHLWMPCQTP